MLKPPSWLCFALAFGLGATALVASPVRNPYRDIVERNVFGLRPPGPTVTVPPPAPLPEVKLVGITTILGDKRALLKVHLLAKPPHPAEDLSCVLTVGEREGPVEVLAIDEVARNVTVNNSGTVMVVKLGEESPEAQPHPWPRRQLPLLVHSPWRR